MHFIFYNLAYNELGRALKDIYMNNNNSKIIKNLKNNNLKKI